MAALARGSQGIYLFNYFVGAFDKGAERRAEAARILRELGDPAALSRRDKVYMVTPGGTERTWGANRHVAARYLPAALTADIKALRYLTAPNMVLSDRRNKSPGLQNGGPMLHMNPHAHRCCQHNWGHGWPYYAQHLYFATPDKGLAAVFYCESQVTITVADGTEVQVEQSTHYPFDEQIGFKVSNPFSTIS